MVQTSKGRRWCPEEHDREALHPQGRPAGAPGPRLDGGEWSPGPDGPEPRLLPAPPAGGAERQPRGGHPDSLCPLYARSPPALAPPSAPCLCVSTVDMSRTFPDNVRFRKDAEPCLQGPLYNVLLAYGHHNHGVGYCQGMNFIAGYLILVTKSEEEAFWLLDALVGRILPADYYSPSMLGLKTDQEVLGELVRLKLPAVAALMDGHGVLWTLVASRWFICLFVDVLPVETVLRVWDCLFSEGSKILFRVALTLLKHHQASILEATSIPDLCEKFKEITRGRFVTECHSFMQRIFSEPGSLSRASIARLRERCRARLLAQG
ncbi:growth hormone-regulated TBC protein 1 isoform X2 [Cervus canadensis]|uniref:growth hormone-regulated TBC protein 1 isoform X2 n=1 Tax=Cervus canadensis TaxID=1574408 RepID=UPI001C9E2C35|nr:growth hormone-regulated TBC protein 1 isoform X2 [Cervus canadensis]